METTAPSAIQTYTFIWPMPHASALTFSSFKSSNAWRSVGTVRCLWMPVTMVILKITTVALPNVRSRLATDVLTVQPRPQVSVPTTEPLS